VSEAAEVSRIVRELEDAWREIQAVHPKVPDVAIYIASGEGKKYGHFGPGDRWLARGADGAGLPEVLIAREGLHRGGEGTFGTLLHEAVHALNAALKVKDHSRGGRYHNAKFKDRAESLGLDVHRMEPYGWARTTFRPETIQAFETSIAKLDGAIRVYMRAFSGVFGQGKPEAL
jgi:hypothetical protein